MWDFFQWIQWHFFQNRGETDFSWAGSNPYLRDNSWWGFALFLLYTQQRPVLRRLQHTYFITWNRMEIPGRTPRTTTQVWCEPREFRSGANSLTCCVETEEERAGHSEGQHPHSCNHECHTPTGALPGSMLIVNWHDHCCVPVKSMDGVRQGGNPRWKRSIGGDSYRSRWQEKSQFVEES